MSFWESEENKAFIEALLELETTEEAQLFIRDLMTEAEVLEFSRRWKAASLLSQGIPYTSIEAETGLSSATIARVSKWLFKGEGGYRLMLKKLGIADVKPKLSTGLKGKVEKEVMQSDTKSQLSPDPVAVTKEHHASDASD